LPIVEAKETNGEEEKQEEVEGFFRPFVEREQEESPPLPDANRLLERWN